MSKIPELLVHLVDEARVLDACVADLSGDDWHVTTPAPGWDVRDQLGHLAYYDEEATVAVRDPSTFRAVTQHRPGDEREREQLRRTRALDGSRVRAWWREANEAMVAAFRSLAGIERLPWFGPEMGAASFVSARTMELWAHGQDIFDALGRPHPPTGALQDVAHLGCAARRYSFANSRLAEPSGPILVELTAPDSTLWTYGDPAATDRVEGPLVDFCLVVTRRRRPEDTALRTTGEEAAHWLPIAQAYAGPPGPGPARAHQIGTDHRAR